LRSLNQNKTVVYIEISVERVNEKTSHNRLDLCMNDSYSKYYHSIYSVNNHDQTLLMGSRNRFDKESKVSEYMECIGGVIDDLGLAVHHCSMMSFNAKINTYETGLFH